MIDLVPQEKKDETSNLIYQAQELKTKDKNLATKILDLNLKDFKKKKKNIYFKDNEEMEFVDDIEYAIKAILQHELTKRVGG